jgi:hypothetical protein
MASDNILDAVDRIEAAVSRFERILYGDPPARPTGLLQEFEALRHDVQGLRSDVQRLQNRQPNKLLWLMGFLSFLAATVFLVVGILNAIDSHNIWDIPSPMALWLSAAFDLVALFLLFAGFGWLDGHA